MDIREEIKNKLFVTVQYERWHGEESQRLSEPVLAIKDVYKENPKMLINEIVALLENEKAKQRENIGMLRQWLNEDRITDPKKMVTNEQIESWLNLTKTGEKEHE